MILTVIVNSREQTQFIENLYGNNDVQLIIVTSTPENFNIPNTEKNLVISNSEDSIIHCLNNAIEHVSGNYFMFASSSAYFDIKKIDILLDILKKNDKDMFMLNPVGQKNTGYFKNDRSCQLSKDSFDIFNLVFESYIFNSDHYIKNRFSEHIYDDAYYKFIIEALGSADEISLLSTIKCYYRTCIDKNILNNSMQYELWWYTDSIDELLGLVVNFSQNNIIQEYVLYLLAWRFICNKDGYNKNIIKGAELKQFIRKTTLILKNINESIIINSKKVNHNLKMIFLRLRNNTTEYNIDIIDNKLECKVDDNIVYSFNNEYISVTNINFYDGKLIINGYFTAREILDSGCKIGSVINKDKVYLNETENYFMEKYFSEIKYKYYTIRLDIPIYDEKVSINFFLEKDGKEFTIPLRFERVQARLNSEYDCFYFVASDKVINYVPEKMAIQILNSNEFKRVKSEYNIFKSLLFSKRRFKSKIHLLSIRVLYWLSYIFLSQKDIWIYYDKLFKADDNGEYIFDYAVQQNDKNNHRYLIKKDSPDYKRLCKKYGNKVLVHGSVKAKLFALHSKKIIATHSVVFERLGISGNERKYMTNLFGASISYVRHGIVVHYLPQAVSRTQDNAILFCCSSKYEVDNISRPEYDYDRNMLKITGAPRFDGLISNRKKNILLAPTWRKSLTVPAKTLAEKKPYNSDFVKSDYFKIYNRLINDESLNLSIKESGYNLQFLLHPTISSQSSDFENKYGVEILKATSEFSYRKVLTEADLMVTDYSGIQFDFAYMKKPIIYYHDEKLPNAFDEAKYNYCINGFGEITKDSNTLINAIISTVKSGCEMEDVYKKRVDDFFYHIDRYNCQRVYKELVGFMPQRI